MPFYAEKEPKVYANILSFLNPKSFQQAAILWKFMQPNTNRRYRTTMKVAEALDEIKKAGATIFNDNDSYLTARIERITGGLTNASFRLTTKKGTYFLRIPGEGSEAHLSREDEAHNLRVIQDFDFNVRFKFIDDSSGLCVRKFIENPTPLTPDLIAQTQTLRDVAHILKTLHTHPHLFKNTMDTFTRLKGLVEKIDAHTTHRWLHDRAKLTKYLAHLEAVCARDTTPLVPCHNDTTHLNFLYQGNTLKLLDWEYSSNNKALFDLANFAVTSELNPQQEATLLGAYFGQAPSADQRTCFEAYKQTTHLWYTLWAELQIASESFEVPLEELKDLAEKHWHLAMQTADSSVKPAFLMGR